MNTRPIFSLVVPCYNDGRYKEGTYLDQLLANIKSQHLDKDEIEIILVDDCSPVSIHETMQKYRTEMRIKYICTDENRGPGGCRQEGAQCATGQWLCFADHDDIFVENAFKKVEEVIEKSKAEYLVVSEFYKVDYNDHTKIIQTFSKNMNFLHGKFYNLDNLWKKYRIEFPSNLSTHEDLAIGSQVSFAMIHHSNEPIPYIEEPIYLWVNNPDSVSNQNYNIPDDKRGEMYEFIEHNFQDSLYSQIEIILDKATDLNLTRDNIVNGILPNICKLWFNYAQWSSLKSNMLNHNLHLIRDLWVRFKADAELTTSACKVIMSVSYKNIKDSIDEASKKYGLLDLYNWLEMLDNMNPEEIVIENKEDDDDRPFFSLVIACYNDGRYKEGVYLDRLLSSVTRQGMSKNDVEVILSDDCSPEPFDWIVDKYRDALLIKTTKTDYNFAPGNTRQKGVDIATGKWLCFADHDDIFYDNALSEVRKSLLEKNENYYALADFNGVDTDGNIIKEYKCSMNWCHAKFYNLDNMWKGKGIHFIKDLRSHEDIAICTQVSCALTTIGDVGITYMNFPAYAWTDNPQSVSHAKYYVEGLEGDPRYFLEVYFRDYIAATGDIYLDQHEKGLIKSTFAKSRTLEILMYCYFYTQGFQTMRPNDFIQDNIAHAGEYMRKCMKAFNLSKDDIYDSFVKDDATIYWKIRPLADPGSGRYVPIQNLREWLNFIDEAAEKRMKSS